MASNTLGEWSDGEDDFVFDIGENVCENSGREWSDPEADDLICNINEEEALARAYGNDNDEGMKFKQDAGRNGDTKATKSQKARTNKGNITTSWKPEGNTIPKNLG